MLKFYRQNLVNTVLTIAAFLLVSGVALAQTNGGGTPNYTGFVDYANCDTIAGWVADTNRLNSSIAVSIYSDGALIVNTMAAISRPDVGNYLGDNGLHGFSVATPFMIKDGQKHRVTILFESSAVQINNGAASLTCVFQQPPPLCADHVITITPLQGQSRVVVNHYCRDKFLRTRYDDGRFVTINDPVAQETRIFDTFAQTYAVVSWLSGGTTDYLAAVSGDLTTQGPTPPVRPPAGCPTGNNGWSEKTPVPSPNSTSAMTQTQSLNVWDCAMLALPMYLEVVDPTFGKTDLDFDNIVVGDPVQWFVAPAGYVRDDLFSLSASYNLGCSVRQTADPVIVTTSGSHLGRTIVTAIADGYGCSFTDALIYVGRSLSAFPLTARGGPVFQMLLFDNGDPQYSNPVDTAKIMLTTSSGVTDSRSMILLKF